MKKLIIIIQLILALIVRSFAGNADTVVINSKGMSKQIKCIVITPSTYNRKRKAFPVVYLLHGYSGNFRDWITKVPELLHYVDVYQLIIVCPDGNYASWYYDSPINPKMRYENYIGTEVPEYIDSAYRTIKDENHRAITGLSMGGHGALFIAWRHSEKFGAAGSMSGGVDLTESAHRFDIEKVLGDTSHNFINWKNYSVVNIVQQKTSRPLSLIIDCGVDDIFIIGNRKLHQELLKLKIPHDYCERSGSHNWEYWRNSITFQLLYFSEYFQAHSEKSK